VIELDLTPHQMGLRCRRGVITAEDGVVTSVEMEEPGKFEVSSADACLANLKK
jgi:peroxiredoxin